MSKISVILDNTESTSPVRGMGHHDDFLSGGSTTKKSRIQELETELLKGSLEKLTGQLGDIFQMKAAEQESGGFLLNEVTLQVELSAEIGFTLVGSSKAGGKGSISLTFKRT